jgi:hypothetical protein
MACQQHLPSADGMDGHLSIRHLPIPDLGFGAQPVPDHIAHSCISFPDYAISTRVLPMVFPCIKAMKASGKWSKP